MKLVNISAWCLPRQKDRRDWRCLDNLVPWPGSWLLISIWTLAERKGHGGYRWQKTRYAEPVLPNLHIGKSAKFHPKVSWMQKSANLNMRCVWTRAGFSKSDGWCLRKQDFLKSTVLGLATLLHKWCFTYFFYSKGINNNKRCIFVILLTGQKMKVKDVEQAE